MVAFTGQYEKLEKPTNTYQVATKAFDKEMPMISIIVKNKKIPYALIGGGASVNIRIHREGFLDLRK